ncbi:GDYXXLXY domain-containing protein [Paludisphaera sp.]|uniref:GDYXXLXY domain-containing protein n=1 Tax=Paludisphaera sp. TaxID=2017432 RepID=UPI00301D27CC
MSTPEVTPAAVDPDFNPPPPRASRTSTLLIAAAAFQFAILAWMIVGTMLMFRVTTSGYVQVVPVDPRDLFTGEYVTLSYAFSRVPPGGIAGLPGPYTYENLQDWQGRPVYVELIPDPARPDHFTGGPPSLTPPAEGVPHLQGTLETPAEITFGIERFHVQEGEGRAYEDAARERKLWARIDVTRHGWAMVKGLAIE